jgi:hypothetical protein
MYKIDCSILISLFVTSYSTMFSWVFKCFQYEGMSIYKGRNEVFTCIQWKLGSFVVLELNVVDLAVYLLGLFIGNCMFSTLLWKFFMVSFQFVPLPWKFQLDHGWELTTEGPTIDNADCFVLFPECKYSNWAS